MAYYSGAACCCVFASNIKPTTRGTPGEEEKDDERKNEMDASSLLVIRLPIGWSHLANKKRKERYDVFPIISTTLEQR